MKKLLALLTALLLCLTLTGCKKNPYEHIENPIATITMEDGSVIAMSTPALLAAIPFGLCIIIMPLAYSISDGMEPCYCTLEIYPQVCFEARYRSL